MIIGTRGSKRMAVIVGVLCLTATAYAVSMQRQNTKPSIAERLQGDDDDVTSAVLDQVAAMPKAKQDALLFNDANSANPSLRYAAIESLQGDKNPQTADVLENAFHDSSASVRDAALFNLMGVDRQRGLRLCEAALRDDDTQIRRDAVDELFLYGDKRAVPGLIGVLGDPVPAVSQTAMAALHKLTGLPFIALTNDSPAKQQAVASEWRNWWKSARGSWPDDAQVGVDAVHPTRLDPAADFEITDTNGRTISLAGQRGHVTLLNFWGTWCPMCGTESADLQRIQNQFAGQGVSVVGIALQEDSEASLVKWCSTHGITYRMAQATDPILDSYGHIDEVPVSVIIDAQGRIRDRWDGPRDYDTFKAAIAHVLSTPDSSAM